MDIFHIIQIAQQVDEEQCCVLRFQLLFLFWPVPQQRCALCVLVYSDSMLPSKYVVAVDVDDHTYSIGKITFYIFKEKSERNWTF